MNDLQWNSITPLMRRALQLLGDSRLSADFYLAGGSGAALQLGHRRSAGLDFFSATDEVGLIARGRATAALQSLGSEVTEAARGNLVLLVDGRLRVGFFGYGYPLVEHPIVIQGMPLAGLGDIGLMKLDAVATHATRKDFHDLYAIAQNLPLRRLFDLAGRKYTQVRDFEAMVVRRLVFFERAEQEPEPDLLKPVDWGTIKQFFREQAVELGRGWLE